MAGKALKVRKKPLPEESEDEETHADVLERIGDYEADVPLKGLKYYHQNPRRGNIEKVAESLKANGQFKPIVVNRGTLTGRKNEILAGNHTTKAARSLGWRKLNVTWVDVDEEHARRIVLADNGSTDDATYDVQILAELLEVQKQTVGNLVGTTYADDVLEKLRVEISTDPMANIDKIEDAPAGQDGINAYNKYVFFQSDKDFDIPELLPEMIPQQFPEKLDIWAGIEVDGDRAADENQWWLAQWHTGNRGIPFERSILSLYTEDFHFEGLFYDPAMNTEKIQNCGITTCIMPNFCVDDQTEALTDRGWVSGEDLKQTDRILCLDGDKQLAWSDVLDVYRNSNYDGKMHHLTHRNMDALVTPGHKFLTSEGDLVPVEELHIPMTLQLFGSAESGGPSIYTDSFVELVGWCVTEGHYITKSNRISVSQKKEPGKGQIRSLLKVLKVKFSEYVNNSGTTVWGFGGSIANSIRRVAPDRVLSADFIMAISQYQRRLLVDTMVAGDGTVSKGGQTTYTQKDKAHVDAFVMLCSLAGIRTVTKKMVMNTSVNGYEYKNREHYSVSLCTTNTAKMESIDFNGGRGQLRYGKENFATVPYLGLVWCPTTEFGNWVCRRNGKVFVTGNSVNQDWPIYTWIWAAARSAYVARYWQEAGLMVIPDIQYGGSDDALDLCLQCIPEGAPIVATQVQTIRGDLDRIRTTARLLKKAEDRIGFSQILVYGHTDADKVVQYAGLDAEIIRVENRTARRRELLDAGESVNSKQVRSKKRKGTFDDD